MFGVLFFVFPIIICESLTVVFIAPGIMFVCLTVCFCVIYIIVLLLLIITLLLPLFIFLVTFAF